MAALLATQDRLAGLRRQVARNNTRLGELRGHQQELTAAITADESRARADTTQLASLAREQYKARDQTNLWQILFSSHDLGQVVNRVVAAQAMSNRTHATVVSLRDQQRNLGDQRAALKSSEADVETAQAQLAIDKAKLLATAADYQAHVSGADVTAGDLLARINRLNAAIAATNRPPGGLTPSQQEVVRIIRAAGARYSVDGDRLVRVARCESGLNPHAYDPGSGASGLFQFMPGTFYGNGGHDIWDAADQSDVAARMFARGDSGAWTCQ